MGNQFSQAFPPEAKFTEKNLPDQAGKVHSPCPSPAHPPNHPAGLHCHRLLLRRRQRARPDPLLSQCKSLPRCALSREDQRRHRIHQDCLSELERRSHLPPSRPRRPNNHQSICQRIPKQGGQAECAVEQCRCDDPSAG
jgi:hypothetical protein